MRRLLFACAMLLALLWAPSAHARPDAKGRPWGKGTIIPRLGLGVGYGQSTPTLRWSAGAGYFVANGLELGGVVSGTHFFWGTDMKLTYPDIQHRLPNTFIELTPLMRYVFYRNHYFSPYAFAGVGPTVMTNNAPMPVIGHWTAGPGFFIGLGRYVFLDISVSFSSRFPYRDCEEAFTDVFQTSEGPMQLEVKGFCGFRWMPGVGIVGSF